MININEIAYTECDLVSRYQNELDKSDTLLKLRETLKYWKPLAEDAFEIVVNKMTEKDFKKFRKSLAIERKGKYSEDEIASIILLPNPMFKISTVAMHFHVPWGCALHRLIDLNELNTPSNPTKKGE